VLGTLASKLEEDLVGTFWRGKSDDVLSKRGGFPTRGDVVMVTTTVGRVVQFRFWSKSLGRGRGCPIGGTCLPGVAKRVWQP